MTGSFFFCADVHKAIRENLTELLSDGAKEIANHWWIAYGATGTVESEKAKAWFNGMFTDKNVAALAYKELECHAPQYIQIERA